MSKLAKKFLWRISAVLIVVTAASLLINIGFIERFYLHQKKNEINRISQKILDNQEQLEQTIQAAEEAHEVVIVDVASTNDINTVNEELRTEFLNKGLGLEKYWFWEQDYHTTLSKGRQLRLYNQGKLNYSLLVEYLYTDGEIIGVAMIIPNVREMITLVNWMTITIFGGAVFLIIILLYFQVKKITSPLDKIGELAKDISRQKFRQIEIQTGDEIEILADSINEMSSRLKENQEELMAKNRQMEALLGNVSHDLKTPLTLVKAYASGIRDGIDDGTFLETILNQTVRMEKMVEGLLELSRMQQKEAKPELTNMSLILHKTIKDQELAINKDGITLTQKIESPVIVNANPEAIESMFTNLITNAVKYTNNKEISLKLVRTNTGFSFTISNGVENNEGIEPERLWEPFFVGEKSRNKEMSGTGLGLSIVRAIAQKQGFEYKCKIDGKDIVFCICKKQ